MTRGPNAAAGGPGRGRARRRGPVAAALLVSAWSVVVLAGCDTARIVAPTPPLRAASAALYAIDVEFAEPLDKASAEDPSRYVVYPGSNPGVPAFVASATLVDTVSWRVVQLLVPDWLGDSTTDRRPTVVETHGVRDWFGRSTGNRQAMFTTGLGYAQNMGAFFNARCSSCHGAASPAGGYRTDSYAALFGPGTTPAANVIAGDPNCLLVVKCRPHNSMYNRAGLDFLDFETVHNWVVLYAARP